MTDTKPRSFWGRVSEFVKNPTQDWSLTRHEGALREQQEQQRIKAREEQRKLDAFIRRRELAALRRMRRRQADGIPIDGLPSDVPDTDGAAAPAPQREATLRKINEIERMMSAPDSRATHSRLTRRSGLEGAELAQEADAIRVRVSPKADDTVPMALPEAGTDLAFPVTDMHAPARMAPAEAPLSLLSRLPPTVLQGGSASTLPLATQMAPTQPADAALLPSELSPPSLRVTTGSFAPSRRPAADAWSRPAALAVDVQEGVSASPLFDQACIDFANANDADAERALLEAISGSPDRELENEFWLALFDLYRAGGNQARFDALVADYVDRFQASAPSWGMPGAATAPSASGTGTASAFTALGELDAAQARALLLLARSGAAQVALDFNALTTVAPAALAQALEALRALDAATGCSIELGGVDNLVDACAVAAPPMQRDLDPAWWHLRLEALRMAGRQDAFENAALDFCVTYEISPPTWEPPKARVRVLQPEFGGADGPATRTPRGARSAFGTSQFGGSGFSPTSTGLALARLEGAIAGGSEDFLKPLDRAAAGCGGIVVNLAELRRLDFSSAGIILNWVMAQTAAGRSVRFEGVHRLIAGLFVILGINSVAQIELRRS